MNVCKVLDKKLNILWSIPDLYFRFNVVANKNPISHRIQENNSIFTQKFKQIDIGNNFPKEV